MFAYSQQQGREISDEKIFGDVTISMSSMQGRSGHHIHSNDDRSFAYEVNIVPLFEKLATLQALDEALKDIIYDAIATLSQGLDALLISESGGSTLTLCAVYRVAKQEKDQKKPSPSILKVVTGQVGDSLAFKLSPECCGTNTKQLTPEHKLSDKVERQRILSKGGKIKQHKEVEYLSGNGGCDSLNMSRSLGDKLLRPFGLIVLPEKGSNDNAIKVHTLSKTDELGVYSDGVDSRKHDDTTSLQTRNLFKIKAGKLLLLGIGDGHGDDGYKVAEYIAQNIGRCVQDQINLRCGITATTVAMPVQPQPVTGAMAATDQKALLADHKTLSDTVAPILAISISVAAGFGSPIQSAPVASTTDSKKEPLLPPKELCLPSDDESGSCCYAAPCCTIL